MSTLVQNFSIKSDTSLNTPRSNHELPIFITGVGKRLGLALALALSNQGYPVIGTYRSETEGIASLRDAGVELHQCDFEQPSEVSRLIETVKAQHSSLRALIHNASDWVKETQGTVDPTLFDRMMNIHARIPYTLNQAFKPLLMPEHESAHSDDSNKINIAVRDIIHISDYVSQTGSAKHIAYAASKAALDNLSLSFAKAYAPEIKVNTIAPALMLFNEHDDEHYKAKALSKAALPKEGGTQEFIEAVNYLLSSQYITGRTIHLDGGRHLV